MNKEKMFGTSYMAFLAIIIEKMLHAVNETLFPAADFLPPVNMLMVVLVTDC